MNQKDRFALGIHKHGVEKKNLRELTQFSASLIKDLLFIAAYNPSPVGEMLFDEWMRKVIDGIVLEKRKELKLDKMKPEKMDLLIECMNFIFTQIKNTEGKEVQRIRTNLVRIRVLEHFETKEHYFERIYRNF